MTRLLTRRSFCTLSAVALASLSLPGRAFADEPEAATTQATSDSIIIVHTNDVHCAVDVDEKNGNLGYAKLVDYVNTAHATYGDANVTLVDAGDAVQGKAIGTLSSGEYLIDIMNQCNYDLVIPGNHEFDYGMDQFNILVKRANAKYLSCNFTDLRTGNLMFDPYAIREYTTSIGIVKVAFVGICTPESLTKSSPAHFQDSQGTYIYGFCEDDTGAALYAAVQRAVDQARSAGANYVVALAHLGQNGVTERWRSTTVAANTTGIDVIIDGHSHEEYVQTVQNAAGESMLITQTGTQLVSIGAVTINPATNTLSATTPTCTGTLVKKWDGQDAATTAFVAAKQAEIETITGQKVGRSDVRLIALEADNYTWAVRRRETNLGDFVADAYLALAWHGGIMADVALINGGGLRADIEPGDITYGDIIGVQPYSNQLVYVETKGQNILDALEMGAGNLPEMSGGFQQVSGLSYTVRTDIPTSVQIVNGAFAGVAGEYRVRDVHVDDQPLDVDKTYKLVSHAFMIMEGGDGMTMFKNDEPVLLDVDNAALIEYLQYDLKGVIGQEYADENGQGRITIKDGPDPEPTPLPTPEPTPEALPQTQPLGGNPLAPTSDTATTPALAAAAVAAFAGAVGMGAVAKGRATQGEQVERSQEPVEL